MSDKDYDEAFGQILSQVEEEKASLTENEQNYLDAWLTKLKEIEDDDAKPIRHDYINSLKSQLERSPRRLSFPFTNMPPSSNLPPIQDLSSSTGVTVPERARYFCSNGEKMSPCVGKGAIVKKREPLFTKSTNNEFENAEEMAKSIARSKGMMLPEFVADISRHTADKGHELRTAMKTEITYFTEYIDRIVNQRVKDIGDMLDQKQAVELLKIQKNYDMWQAELSVCKKRIKELVPEFDIEAYRKDKNYLKKIMIVDVSASPVEDKFKEWKEENCHRLMWFVNELHKLTEENNQVVEEIASVKAKQAELERKECEKYERQSDLLQEECRTNKQLKQKSDKLARDITVLLVSLKN